MTQTVSQFVLLCLCIGFTLGLHAQSSEQNPRWQESYAKYQIKADSLNSQHATTLQQTYSAPPDWYLVKQQDKRDRIQFRRDLRMERARGWYRYPYNYGYSSPYYGNPYNSYAPYRRYGFFWF